MTEDKSLNKLEESLLDELDKLISDKKKENERLRIITDLMSKHTSYLDNGSKNKKNK